MGEKEEKSPLDKLRAEATGKMIMIGIGCSLIAIGVVVTVLGARPLIKTWEKIKEQEKKDAKEAEE